LVSLKIVVLVVTRKPASRAFLIASTAVVNLAHAVEMDDERHAVAWLEDVEVLLEAQRVRAEIDVLTEVEHAGHHVLDALVDERLASADRDHRGGALCTCVDALLDGQPRLVRLVLADLPAADARDIAGERRLEHEDERVALPLALLSGDVLADLDG